MLQRTASKFGCLLLITTFAASLSSCGSGKIPSATPEEQEQQAQHQSLAPSAQPPDASVARDVARKPGDDAADDASRTPDDASLTPVTETPRALGVLASLRARFTVKVLPDPRQQDPSGATPNPGRDAGAGGQATVPVLGNGAANRFDSSAGGVIPSFSAQAGRRARVILSKTATLPFRIEDVAANMAVEVTLRDALNTPAEAAQGYLIYPNGHASGATLLHRALADGIEDYWSFDQRPAAPTVAYDVALRQGVQGLRLVGNTLEMLDASGAPRLRVSPPFLMGANGNLVEASLAVDNCAYDENPAPPWGRAVVAPGADSCRLRVTWAEDQLVYPALLDPKWSTTGSMSKKRTDHTATLLSNGKVLVAGGNDGTYVFSSAELYDRTTGTWAATGSMTGARMLHTATLLGTSSNPTTSGKLLVAGGYNGSSTLSTAQLYSPTAGTWTAAANLNAARKDHTATRLANGKVLVAGGANGSTTLNTAAVYNPASGTGSWAAVGNMATARKYHTATLLVTSNGTLNNKVLVVGGRSSTSSLTSVQLFDGTSSWTTLTALSSAREQHTATVVANGKVLIAGGKNGATTLATTLVFNPASGSGSWTSGGNMTSARHGHSATLLSSAVLNNGQLLVAGGWNGSAVVSSAELWNGTSTWTPTTPLPAPVKYQTETLLSNGMVLIAGGVDVDVDPVSKAYLYDPSRGSPCSTPTQCASGFCASGVCCDTACTDACGTCNLTGATGTCSPRADGTACSDDANPCTVDRCNGASLSCQHPAGNAGAACRPATNDCDLAESCSGTSTTCPNDGQKPNGMACTDGNTCTTGETCLAGQCGQPMSSVVCVALDEYHLPGTCEAASGICTNPVKPDLPAYGLAVAGCSTSPPGADNTDALTPTLHCVSVVDSGYTAVFGYVNVSNTPIWALPGDRNRFTPTPYSRGQPSYFEPGEHRGAFYVSSSAESPLTWTLGGRSVVAMDSSPPCELVIDERGEHARISETETLLIRKRTPVAEEPTVLPTQETSPGSGNTVGKTGGRPDVSASGIASYTVPLWTPPARGIAPALSLNYTSQADDGILGIGWQVGSLSSITRCRKTRAQDGDTAPIRFEPSDRFCLDGARLVAVAGDYGSGTAEYRTENDQFSKIVTLDADALGPRAFRVYTKDGRILTYGSRRGGLLEGRRVGNIVPNLSDTPATTHIGYSQTVRLTWSLSQVEDRTNNRMIIEYGVSEDAADGYAHEQWPEVILYANVVEGPTPTSYRRVRFEYQPSPRPDARFHYISGFKLRSTKLLSAIVAEDSTPGSTPVPLRRYAFTYSNPTITGRTLLSQLTELDGSGIRKAPTTFDYELGSLEYVPFDTGITDVAPFSPTGFQGYPASLHWDITPMDVDKDGKDDILYKDFIGTAQSSWGRSRWAFRLSNGTGFNNPVHSDQQVFYWAPARPIPIDVNGGIDFLALEATETDILHYRHLRFTGQTFLPASTASETIEYNSRWQTSRPSWPGIYGGDLDGDGRPEIIKSINELATSGSEWGYRLNQGGGENGNYILTNLPSGSVEFGSYIADIDGDGKAEFLTEEAEWQDPPPGGHRRVAPNSSNWYRAWNLDAGGGLRHWRTSLYLGFLPRAENDRHTFMDINGDGLQDDIRYRLGTSTEVEISLNTGNGFIPMGKFEFPPGSDNFPRAIPTSSQLDGSTDAALRVFDYDLDGRQDLVLMGKCANCYGPEPLELFRSTGASFQVSKMTDRPGGSVIETGLPDNRGNNRLSHVLDVNGDGLPDLLEVVGPLQGPAQLRLWIRQGKMPDKLIRVTDGFGARVEYDYKPITDPTVYTPPSSCTYPQVCVHKGPDVVSEMRVDNLVGADTNAKNRFTFQYLDGRSDIIGRGFLGYGSRIVTDHQTGRTLRTDFDNVTRAGTYYPLAGLPRLEVSDGPLDAGRQYRRAKSTISQVRNSGNVPYHVVPFSVIETESDSPGSEFRRIHSVLQHDEYGNLTTRDTTHSDGEHVNEVYDIPNDAGRWIIGRPRSTTVTHAMTGVPNGTRRIDYERNPDTGLVRSQTTTVAVTESGIDQLTTTFERDSYGMVTGVIRTNTAGHRRDTRVTYETRIGLFPETVTNHLGHVQRFFFDIRFGHPIRHDDPNDVTTRWRYDGFGRLRQEEAADGAHLEMSYGPSGNPYYPFQVVQRRLGGEENVIRHDRLDRPGLTGRNTLTNRPSWVITEYNAQGRPSRVSNPHFVEEEPTWNTFNYDTLSRLLDKTYADGRFEIHRYSGLTVETDDPKSNRRRMTFNQRGLVKTSTDVHDNGHNITTTYNYAPFGLLREVIDPLGNHTTMAYDVGGRRTLLVDPDVGIRRFEYNAFGDLLEERAVDGAEATLRSTSYVRDALGRVTCEASSDGPTRFEWDTAAHAVGQIAATTSASGVLTSKRYDALGRPTNERTGVSGAVYQFDTQYGDFGRLARLWYPEIGTASRFAIEVGYHPFSNELDRVSDVQTGTAYWHATDANAADQLTHTQFGNAVQAVRVYSPTRGWLNEVQTVAPSGSDLQKFILGRDANGNIESRNDVAHGQLETFSYDTLNRLTGWTTGPFLTEYGYNDIGNLTTVDTFDGQQSHSVTRTYGINAGPHALTQSEFGSYTYDPLGDQVSGPEHQMDYTNFDLPKQVRRGSATYTFAYDANHNRVLKSADDGTGNEGTISVGGLYEKRIVPGGSKHVFHIPSPAGNVAEVIVAAPDGAPFGDTQVLYLHDDQLGSVRAVTNASGDVVSRVRTDPWGDNVDPLAPQTRIPRAESDVHVGFTGHEHDDEFGLINMKGRMYDPKVGRFLTPDPIVQAPFYGQSLNRYGYVFNNPLRFRDPSGFQLGGECVPPNCPVTIDPTPEPTPTPSPPPQEPPKTGTPPQPPQPPPTPPPPPGISDQWDASYAIETAFGGAPRANGAGGAPASDSPYRNTGQLTNGTGTRTSLGRPIDVIRGMGKAIHEISIFLDPGLEQAINEAVPPQYREGLTDVPDSVLESVGEVVGSALYSGGMQVGGPGKELQVVQRAMSTAELEATREIGLLRGGKSGIHYVSNAVNSTASRAQIRLALPNRPEVRVTMAVPGGTFSAPATVKPLTLPDGTSLLGGGTERTATGKIPVIFLKVEKY